MAKVLVAGVLLLVVGLGLWWAVAQGPLRDPEDALADFYEAKDRAEDQLMDPLILNGRRVVPLVVAEIPNKEMRLRRYAIGFLGNGRYAEALPALEEILRDDSEVYYFRADALEAIYQISQDKARALAPAYTNGEDLLGQAAREIVAGRSPVLWERTYFQAFLHRHE